MCYFLSQDDACFHGFAHQDVVSAAVKAKASLALIDRELQFCTGAPPANLAEKYSALAAQATVVFKPKENRKAKKLLKVSGIQSRQMSSLANEAADGNVR